MMLYAAFFIAALTLNAQVTYYVRTDGGTATQCSGLADAPLGGSTACAWSHPFWALTDKGAWKLNGGDTLIIGAGSYGLGLGAPNSLWCNLGSSCQLPPLPSGSAAQPTHLYGTSAYAACPLKPTLWGTGGAGIVLSLQGSSHVDVQCLEITDHETCGQLGLGAGPYGCAGKVNWASDGVNIRDASAISLSNLWIHGMAHNGVSGGRTGDLSMTDVTVEKNPLAGVDFSPPSGATDNPGTHTFTRLKIYWSGCVEAYPTAALPVLCTDQYGDGFGLDTTGGVWQLYDSEAAYNMSDGFDLLYLRNPGATLDMQRTKAHSNVGNQLKASGQTFTVQNNIAIGNCDYMATLPFVSFPYGNSSCRGGGASMFVLVQNGGSATVSNNTFVSPRTYGLMWGCSVQSNCTLPTKITYRNNIFYNAVDMLGQAAGTKAYAYADNDGSNWLTQVASNNLLFNAREACPRNPNDVCSLPGFTVYANDSTVNVAPTPTSPTIGAGTTLDAPPTDFASKPRPKPPSIGALEYATVPPKCTCVCTCNR